MYLSGNVFTLNDIKGTTQNSQPQHKTFFPMRNLLNYAAIACLAAFTACNNPQSAEQIAGTAANKTQNTTGLRAATAASKKALATAVYYKTLAAFEKGKATADLGTLATLNNAKVSLVVMFESGATWATPFTDGNFSKTGDDKFNGLMESHGLAIAKHFEIDDMFEGLVLESSKGTVDNPIEAAREISMVESVMMVEVKELPADVNSSTVSK